MAIDDMHPLLCMNVAGISTSDVIVVFVIVVFVILNVVNCWFRECVS